MDPTVGALQLKKDRDERSHIISEVSRSLTSFFGNPKGIGYIIILLAGIHKIE